MFVLTYRFMIRFTYKDLEEIISEDLPLMDLTSEILDIKGNGIIRYIAREDGIVCGTEEVIMIFDMLGITTKYMINSGTPIKKGELIISGCQEAKVLHKAWKVCLNILEYMSGIATNTKNFVEKARTVNQNIIIATTRKVMPFTKKLVLKSIITGGALPYRTSLSDTFLIFKQHMVFKPFEEILNELDIIKKKLINKKVGIEVESYEQAVLAIKKGFELIQLDKWNIENIKQIVNYKNTVNQNVFIVITGGINFDNIGEYAKTGVDIIVTSSLYQSKPMDIKVEMEKES